MIPKSKTELPDSLKNQLTQTLDNSEDIIEEPKEKGRRGQVNFTVPDDVKVSWKIICDKNHVTLKQGLTFAMEHLIQELENEEVILTVGGVMKKRR